jgi:uncharacterized protein (DUF302 family)
MTFYFEKTVGGTFEEVVSRLTESMKTEGFGIMTDIDVQGALAKKLGVQFRKYKILGACNPQFAYQALQLEDKIGVMLPCNFIIQERSDGSIEVAAVNPLQTMQSVGHPGLRVLAEEAAKRLQRVVESL